MGFSGHATIVARRNGRNPPARAIAINDQIRA
jgi:hypothetical protein